MSPAAPSPDWTEQIPPDEDATLERYAQAFAAIQAKNADGARKHRALHNKPLAVARGELEVLGDLPDPARVGIFAAPGRLAPEEFRPLGAMMRARNVTYRVSTQNRQAAPEPKMEPTA